MSVTPAMRPNWRSRGIATAEAIVSGLAPGSAADTWMVGNSTCGMGDTGRRRNARPPARASARVRDRKSTRLNSSHGYISYAVFCLKKKKKQDPQVPGAVGE